MALEFIIKNKMDDPCATSRRSEQAGRIKRSSNPVRGWWENIGPEPIYIEDKEHLKRVCTKLKVIPKMFMKHKSQGKGYEWNY